MEEETFKNEKYLKLTDPKLETDQGWIDMRGNFYPCEYYGHYQLLQDMLEGGFMEGMSHNDAENHLIKISGGDFYTYAKNISPRARLTIETIIEKHMMLSATPIQLGQYEFWIESGKAKSRRA